MSATEHVTTTRPPAPSLVSPRMTLPWQPDLNGAVADSPPFDTPAAAWSTTIASVPYLAETRFGAQSIVYKPPTVIQLSEATGCSISDLAGAYNDLPVIRLCKESPRDAAAPAATPELQKFDAFDYLQLAPTDETLELATNAVWARRPVPDAEETFWEADYWEKLKRIKQEQQQRKEQRRQNKAAQESRKELTCASVNTVGFPSAYTLGNTLSTSNSPSFMTPRSRQGSLSGHAADADASLTMASLPSAQRQKRIAKGLLRRARYNESHAQQHFTRSASLLSQNSTGPPPPQTITLCRTRPRSYSTNSQLTDARGFQYSLSSVMSEGGRSAFSDSLHTPPLLSINSMPQSREALATSPDLELSMSGGAAKSGTTTCSRNSAVGRGRGATPPISPPRDEPVPSQRSSRLRTRTGAGAKDPSSTLSADSRRSSPRRKTRDGSLPSNHPHPHRGASALNGNCPLVVQATDVTTTVMAARLYTPLATPTASSSTLKNAPEEAPPEKSNSASPQMPLRPPAAAQDVPASVRASDASPAVTAASTARAFCAGELDMAPTSSTGMTPLTIDLHCRSSLPHSVESGAEIVMKTDPNSQCTTARPHNATGASAGTASSRTAAGASHGLKTAPLIPASAGKASAFPPPAAQEQEQLCAPRATSPTKLGASNGHPTLTMIADASKPYEQQRADAARDADLSKGSALDKSSVALGKAVSPSADSEEPGIVTPTLLSHEERYGRPGTASPTPSTSTQGPSVQEASLAKSATVTATPSGSSTPRPTATTVPPSRTPTREASASLRFERAIAVHSGAPRSPKPVDSQPAAVSRETAGTAAYTVNSSQSASLVVTQQPRAPTHASSAAPQPASSPTPPPTQPLTVTNATAASSGSPPSPHLAAPAQAAKTPAPAKTLSSPPSTRGGSSPNVSPAVKASGASRSVSASHAAEKKPAKPSTGANHSAIASKAKPEKNTVSSCCTVM